MLGANLIPVEGIDPDHQGAAIAVCDPLRDGEGIGERTLARQALQDETAELIGERDAANRKRPGFRHTRRERKSGEGCQEDRVREQTRAGFHAAECGVAEAPSPPAQRLNFLNLGQARWGPAWHSEKACSGEQRMKWILLLGVALAVAYIGLRSMAPDLAQEFGRWVSHWWARMWMLLPISSYGN